MIQARYQEKKNQKILSKCWKAKKKKMDQAIYMSELKVKILALDKLRSWYTIQEKEKVEIITLIESEMKKLIKANKSENKVRLHIL